MVALPPGSGVLGDGGCARFCCVIGARVSVGSAVRPQEFTEVTGAPFLWWLCRQARQSSVMAVALVFDFLPCWGHGRLGRILGARFNSC